MKYSAGVEIDLPVDKVLEIFNNPDNMDKWMEGLLAWEVTEGTAGQPGAKMLMKFKMGKREMEMTETIIKANLPDEFVTTYEAKGVYNIVTTRFQSLDENRTRYVNEQKFRFSGFMKFFGFIMPGAFKKQTLKYLNDFKNFAEKGVIV